VPTLQLSSTFLQCMLPSSSRGRIVTQCDYGSECAKEAEVCVAKKLIQGLFPV